MLHFSILRHGCRISFRDVLHIFRRNWSARVWLRLDDELGVAFQLHPRRQGPEVFLRRRDNNIAVQRRRQEVMVVAVGAARLGSPDERNAARERDALLRGSLEALLDGYQRPPRALRWFVGRVVHFRDGPEEFLTLLLGYDDGVLRDGYPCLRY